MKKRGKKKRLAFQDRHEVIEQVAHKAGVWFHWFTCSSAEWAAAFHFRKKTKKKQD